ncbi:Phytochrome A [Linum perenne]
MSNSRPTQSSTSRHTDRVIAQTTVDAKLHAEFEESGSSFDYSSSIRVTSSSLPPQQLTTAYLHHIQKGKRIQPFGCLLALDEKSYRVIAYSENAPEMLTMVNHAVPSVGEVPILGIGTDLRTIFTPPSATALIKALGFGDIALLNPILVHCKTSGKPFYAIVHRVTGSLIVDFEPVKPYEVSMTTKGALQSYMLAAKAITRLQALPSGSMERLCDTMVQEVFELSGYDRVMAYRFHDDDHGEVVSEVTKPGLEPYLGLHYPATDIPQAARFLFMKNKVRMIVDCRANHVKVLQDDKLEFDLTLCGSTLRAPHSCHLQYMENMDSIASLVMAVIVNESDDDGGGGGKRKRLWGLVVCHNSSPRFVPFPLRSACEFLAQVFAIHVNKELELENQIVEKNILRTQTLLCDMLMRDAPLGIVTQSPNVMDLVKCDGAALLYKGKIYRLGMAPSDFQIQDIARWLSDCHMDSTGLSTDSLFDAGYPGALALGDVVCGMAAVRISSSDDLLFWFRAQTASEVRWGGAKHEPGKGDDGRKMHPRSSFRAFLEVVKTRSLPWKDYEMDAIHSLQLILRNAFKDIEGSLDVDTRMIHSRLGDLKIDSVNGMQELEAVTGEMVRLIETATVPILAVDVDGVVNGWNSKIAELTGLPIDEAIGKHLLTLVEESSVETVQQMLSFALEGKEEQNVQFEIKTHGSRRQQRGPITLVVNACASRDLQENVVGVCFVAQDITGHKIVLDKFTRIEGDYKSIVQNPNPLIPPIFGADEFGWCSEWNTAMTNLTGLSRESVLDKMLLGEVFGTNTSTSCCRLKNKEAFVNLGIVLNNAMAGHEPQKVSFGFFSRSGKYVDCLLCLSKKLDREGAVTGVFCFLQLASQELQRALHVQRLSEQTAVKRLKALAYIKRQVRNPLSGIVFSRKMMERTELGAEQKQLLQTSAQCQRQLSRILDDSDLDSIIEGCLDLEMVEFTLHEVMVASISQVMMKCNSKGIRIVNDAAEEIMSETLYGDSIRLQQVLADFLLISVNSTPPTGQLTVAANLTKDPLGQSVHLVNLELRITHAGPGIPEGVLSQMFGTEGDTSEEGIGLLVSMKLVKLMNGDVKYLRESGKSSFIISVELAAAHKLRT